MFRQLSQKNKTAAATIEYIALVTFLLIIFLVFQKYIYQAMEGRWQTAGESQGFGLRYDPQRTVQCEFDFLYTNGWYNLQCYEQKCDCESVRQTYNSCQNCILLNCATPQCDT